MINMISREDIETRRKKQQEQVKGMFRNFMIDLESYQCSLLSFLLYQYPRIQIPIFVTFIIIATHQLYLLVLSAYNNKKQRVHSQDEENVQKNVRLKQELIERLYMMSFIIILAIIYFNDLKTNIVLIIPSTLILITRLRIYCMESKEVECLNVTNFFFLSCRLFLLIASLSVSIKLDGYVDWSWRQTFWFFWVILSILIGIIFGILIMIVSKIVQFILQELPIYSKCYEIKSLFWFSEIFMASTVITYLWMTDTVDYSENSQDLNQPFKLCICILVGHMMFSTFLTVLWYKDLIKMLSSLLYIENDVQLNVEDPNQVSPNTDVTRLKKPQHLNNRPPKLLQKISSTYFSVNSSQAQRNLSSNLQSERTQITNQRNHSLIKSKNKKTQTVISIGDRDDRKGDEDQNNQGESEQDKINNNNFLDVDVPGVEIVIDQKTPEVEQEEQSVQLCLVCFDKPPNSVYMPCGHGGICYQCGLNAWKKKDECFLCRKKIIQLLEIEVAKKGEIVQVISTTQPQKIKN